MLTKFFLKLFNSRSIMYKAEYARIYAIELEKIEKIKENEAAHQFEKDLYFDMFGKIKKDYLELVESNVHRQVKRNFAVFIDKQVAKLNKILKDLPVDRISVVGRELDCVELKLTFFNSKNCFSVRNKYVYVSDKRIIKYPTTFHDIKIGEDVLKSKSYDWMIENFHL